jgi:hypothetical protein
MTIRAPEPDDAPGLLAIVRAHGLPAAWTWPAGKHGLVVDNEGGIEAFCILSETIYGLVIEELWELPTRQGIAALGMLYRKIEEIAQSLADERGIPIAAGGLVRDERATHIRALAHRGYGQIGVIMEKVFVPSLVPA